MSATLFPTKFSGLVFPRSLKVFSSILVFPETQLLSPCSKLYFPFVPLFPKKKKNYGHVPLFAETLREP